MSVILTIVGFGLALSLFVSHFVYALMDRLTSRDQDPEIEDRERIARDLRYRKLL